MIGAVLKNLITFESLDTDTLKKKYARNARKLNFVTSEVARKWFLHEEQAILSVLMDRNKESLK